MQHVDRGSPCDARRTRRSEYPFSGFDIEQNTRLIAQEINSNVVTQAGMWGRALLLQLAHPLVASAVAKHGRLLTDPTSGKQRLLRTVDAIYMLMLGSAEEADHVARRLHAIHAGVRGQISESRGGFASGTGYKAHDPELLRWVYATLVDSALVSHQRFVRPLSPAEKDAYCLASRRLGLLVGMREEDIPGSASEIREYVESMLASTETAVTEQARLLAHGMFRAPLPAPLRPLRTLAKLAGLADLPPALRRDYGFTWTRGHGFLLAASGPVVRALQVGLPSVPTALGFMQRGTGDAWAERKLDRSLARL